MCLSIIEKRPDVLLNRGEHAGFQWVVVHNGSGHRCGYIRIPIGHPWHGVGEPDCSVHGRITFAEADEPCDKGGADDAWWIGFDCCHIWDAPDPKLPGTLVRLGSAHTGATVKSQVYVERECRSLCEQAAAVAPN